MNFLECYLNGATNFTMLDKWIKYWHTHNTNMELCEFLGFDVEDYISFLSYGLIKFKIYIDRKYVWGK